MWNGWALTGWAAVGMAALVASELALHGFSEEGIREIVRWTTRFGAPTLALVFAARPLQQLLRKGWTAWALRNRRYLGVAFGVMHFTHLGALLVLPRVTGVPFLDAPALAIYGGGFIYLQLTAMLLTSFDVTTAWVGRRAWRVIHVWGVYSLWFALALNYTAGTLTEDIRQAPLSLVLLAALGARFQAWRVRR